jgi:hypothetical protein
MRPRASTLRTPAWLATPAGAEAIGPRHLRWVTSDKHTPGVSRERLSVYSGFYDRDSKFTRTGMRDERGCA